MLLIIYYILLLVELHCCVITF